MKAKRLLCFALCLAMLVAMFAGCNVAETPDGVEETTTKAPAPVKKPATTSADTEAITEGDDATEGEATEDNVTEVDTTVSGEVNATENATNNEQPVETQPGEATNKPAEGTAAETVTNAPVVEGTEADTTKPVATNKPTDDTVAEEGTVAGVVTESTTTKPAVTEAVTTKPSTEEKPNTDKPNTDKPNTDKPLGEVPVSEKNYEDTFNFLILNDIFKFEYFYAAEEGAEVMNNAVYTRQEEVRAQIGIEIMAKKHEVFTEYKTDFETSVKAEDGLYQSCLTHVNVDVAPMVTSGLLYNFDDFSSVNLDKSYWNKDLMDSLKYKGEYFLAYGDFLLATTYVVSFNKTLLDKYCAQDLGDSTLYDLVNTYKWTFDQMLTLASKAHDDKNGDGKKDTTDSYGISGYMWVPACSFLHASGLNITKYNSSTGKYEEALSANGKKMLNLVTKVKDMYDAEYSFFWDPIKSNPTSDPSKMVTLKDGNTLFYFAGTNELTKFVETDIEFGILPYPMWDEAQKEYRSLSWNGYMVVPYNIDTVYGEDKAGDTLELLGYYSAPVTTAFYEKLLGAQVSESPDDADMLNIVWNSQVSDFGMAYSSFGNKALDVMLYSIPRIVLEHENIATFARLWAKYQKQVNTDLTKLQK